MNLVGRFAAVIDTLILMIVANALHSHQAHLHGGDQQRCAVDDQAERVGLDQNRHGCEALEDESPKCLSPIAHDTKIQILALHLIAPPCATSGRPIIVHPGNRNQTSAISRRLATYKRVKHERCQLCK
jgi:hypothetical protein